MQGGKKYSPKSITFTSFFCGSGDRRPSSALRQSPAFAFLGGPLKLFFALRCLLFSQTKLIPVNYYHPGMNGFGTETWGRVSKMAFWDAHQVITATRSVCVCLNFWERAEWDPVVSCNLACLFLHLMCIGYGAEWRWHSFHPLGCAWAGCSIPGHLPVWLFQCCFDHGRKGLSCSQDQQRQLLDFH